MKLDRSKSDFNNHFGAILTPFWYYDDSARNFTTSVPTSYSSSPFLSSPFVFSEMQNADWKPYDILVYDELFLMDDPEVEKISTVRNREIRALTDRDRVRCTFVTPRKRSMSLLVGSWRSTEPSTLKRKLNEISNRQELPRIGPIKPPPVPRTCTRIY